MKIAIMQPYYFPYIGYFQLIKAVDKFIFYDDVNYIKQGWVNRNRILMDGKEHFFTLKLKGASSFKLINEIEVFQQQQQKKLIKTLFQIYSKAPYFDEVIKIIQEVFNLFDELKSIAKIAEESVKKVSEYLELSTLFETSSEKYSLTRELHGEERILAICQQNHANIYVNPSGGSELYNANNFNEKGIQLYFIQNHFTPYKQFSHTFINGLSIIDVMMFNEKKTIKGFLNNYELK